MARRQKPRQGKAEPPLARESPKSGGSRVRDLEKRLAEALQQQTATGEILRVISSSPTDVQPVFDAIAESAARLCESFDSIILRASGDHLAVVAHHGPIPIDPGGLPLTRESVPGRALLDGRTFHLPDLQTEADKFPVGSDLARRLGFRTVLNVPLMRDSVAIGVITLRRTEVKLFTDRQVELLQTFADQAVIAIENVRLFKELEARNRALAESLDQQTATSEILRVISESPTDYRPVFDTIVRNATSVCAAHDAVLALADGEDLVIYAQHGPIGAPIGVRNPMRDTAGGLAVSEARPVHVKDLAEADEFPAGRDMARRAGHRTTLCVPLMREGTAMGTIMARRAEVRPFTDNQIALLRTFADQAVIAIENVRLFTELQEKNQALTKAHAQVSESLEQQTATSEILRVISSSPTDVQPTFDAIAESAVELCGAEVGLVTRLDDDWVVVKAVYGTNAAGLDAISRVYPMRPSGVSAAARAIRECAIAHIPDVLNDEEYGTQETALAAGFRAALAVPMVREGHAVGSIAIGRGATGEFSERQIKLLGTFAEQALIAIENVRLFTETKEALERQTATSEILRVISSSPTDTQPVFDAIARNALTLCGGTTALVLRFDGEMLRLAGHHAMSSEGIERNDRAFPRRPARDFPTGRAFLDRSVVHVPDLQAATEFVASTARQRGAGSLLCVPLLHEHEAIGVIGLTRDVIGSFSPQQIQVLMTFADQAVIAIENVRLFKELELANRELAAASQHKSEFLANMSHELRTPLNAIIGFSEVLSERMFGELNDKQDEYLKDIHASGQHLLSLINDILDLSKIEAGRTELELTDFDLPTAIDNALMLVRERAGRRAITLQTAVDPQLGQVCGDERKIRQIVLNLLSNAIKFTPEGGRIGVAATRKDGLVEISVSDTGVGIAPEDQEAVFEEFRQVGTAAKKVEGTGLGLTLCRKFVELHGGRIWVKSEVGQGSTFTFTVPVRRGE